MMNMPATAPDLGEEEFERIAKLVTKVSGIRLGPQKFHLVRGRLLKRLRDLQLPSFDDYYEYAVDESTGEELRTLVSLLTTNKTEFFREPIHFQHLMDRAIPQLLESQKEPRQLRLWSAACSTGMEPVTMAMVCFDATRSRPGAFKILGTDLSALALQKAKNLEFEDRDMNAVPPEYKQRLFESETRDGRKIWKAGKGLKSVLTFGPFNLNMDGPYLFREPFDVVFLRNVMIYFSKETQQRVIDRITSVTRPGGFLYTGLSENLMGIQSEFQKVGPAVYQRRGGKNASSAF